jgi:hypothetical protein
MHPSPAYVAEVENTKNATVTVFKSKTTEKDNSQYRFLTSTISPSEEHNRKDAVVNITCRLTACVMPRSEIRIESTSDIWCHFCGAKHVAMVSGFEPLLFRVPISPWDLATSQNPKLAASKIASNHPTLHCSDCMFVWCKRPCFHLNLHIGVDMRSGSWYNCMPNISARQFVAMYGNVYAYISHTCGEWL